MARARGAAALAGAQRVIVATPRVLHDDGRVLVLFKPAGLPTVPYRTGDRATCLRAWVETTLGERVFVVHRLDKDTSGVIVMARDADTHRMLSGLFEHRRVRKTYLAAVVGHIAADAGVIDAPLREFGSGRIAVDPRGRPSETSFRVRERLRDADLLEVSPKTGRRHQIRVHLYHLGHPVLGDVTYGRDRPVGGAARLLLHAWRLELPLATGDLAFEVPLEADFETALAPWRV